MRKVTASLWISLDGVVESPDRWVFPYVTAEAGQAIESAMAVSDTLLLGRRTYEEFAAVWPERGDSDPIGAYMNNTPKIVVSATIDNTGWGETTVIAGNVAEEIGRLKRRPGKNINVVGSGTLVRSLLRDGLVDELALMVYPVVVGTGERLFEDGGGQFTLKLVDSVTYRTGLVFLTYEPACI